MKPERLIKIKKQEIFLVKIFIHTRFSSHSMVRTGWYPSHILLRVPLCIISRKTWLKCGKNGESKVNGKVM